MQEGRTHVVVADYEKSKGPSLLPFVALHKMADEIFRKLPCGCRWECSLGCFWPDIFCCGWIQCSGSHQACQISELLPILCLSLKFLFGQERWQDATGEKQARKGVRIDEKNQKDLRMWLIG